MIPDVIFNTIHFTDDNGHWYEFWFSYSEIDRVDYVEIIHYRTDISWSKFARNLDKSTHTIEWQSADHQSFLISKNAMRYIEKIYKNKAFL